MHDIPRAAEELLAFQGLGSMQSVSLDALALFSCRTSSNLNWHSPDVGHERLEEEPKCLTTAARHNARHETRRTQAMY